MATNLRIRELSISTATGDYPYVFQAPITAVTGPIGCGKSSMLEVIKHTLGGNATLTPVIEENVSKANVLVDCGQQKFQLQRPTRGRMNMVDIRTLANGEKEVEMSVRESEKGDSVSRALLKALGLPMLSIPRSRTRAAAATSSLTFNDVYTYVYLQQAEIDRSVVYHLDSYREPKRKTVFELLFGLTDPELIELEVLRGQVADRIREAQTRASSVGTFLREASAGDEEELAVEHERLRAELASARAQLDDLRNEVKLRSADDAAIRDRIRRADAEASEARQAAVHASGEVSAREALVAQLELDLGRQERLGIATAHLGPIEFVVCPRCLQSLSGREVPDGCCILCAQREPIRLSGSNAEQVEELRHLEAQLEETRQLLESDREHCRSLEARARGLEVIVARLRADLDARTRDFVTPRFEAIADTAASAASSEAGLEAVNRIRAYWSQYRELESEISNLTEHARQLDHAIESGKARLSGHRQRLDELSSIFDEIVRFLEVPWYQSARIDTNTYLPIVNGRPFQTLAVAGGMKTLVNVAYHLALLTFALSQPDTSMPDLLIIDSPRKNLGQSSEDSALTDRIYRRFRMLADAYGNRVQMIIADNDLPPLAREFVHEIHLDYEHPFVPDVQHPGPDAVERIGVKPKLSRVR